MKNNKIKETSVDNVTIKDIEKNTKNVSETKKQFYVCGNCDEVRICDGMKFNILRKLEKTRNEYGDFECSECDEGQDEFLVKEINFLNEDIQYMDTIELYDYLQIQFSDLTDDQMDIIAYHRLILTDQMEIGYTYESIYINIKDTNEIVKIIKTKN